MATRQPPPETISRTLGTSRTEGAQRATPNPTLELRVNLSEEPPAPAGRLTVFGPEGTPIVVSSTATTETARRH